jgi:acyl-[acyl-carrier-protein]-phospholipid O-acyltransferase/long-chain-fatty-acid--[acyl-carrier-protein] ligase
MNIPGFTGFPLSLVYPLAVSYLWLGLGTGLFALILIASVATLACWRAEVVVRLLLWLPACLFYRIRVLGREHIPASGPALLICNHISFLDALLIFLSQKRPVRFVIRVPFTRLPGMGLLLRLARVIPMESTTGIRAVLQSLRAAKGALQKGELVCIFTESAISPNGPVLPLPRVLKQILKRSSVPIIPVCLNHVWGSLFTYQGDKLLSKWPQVLPYPVSIAFGPPMPSATRAIAIRQAIQELSADCSIARNPERCPVHRQFVRIATKHPLRPCIIDPTSGRTFRCAEALAAAWVLARLLRPVLEGDPMVAVWLPPSAGAAFANVALSLLGKPVVNLNYSVATASVHSAIQQCGIRHVLTSRLFTTKMPLEPGPGVELTYLEDFRKQITTFQRLRALLTVFLLPEKVLSRWVFKIDRHKPDDLAAVIFSSGSTGDPKGVMLTHGNLAANAESMIQAIDPGPRDRLLGVLPLFHSFGYTVTLWVPLLVGASLIFYPDPRQSKEIGELCRKYRCTIYLTTPTLLRFCLKRCGTADFRSLRILMVGAEKLPATLAQEFKARFGVLPLEGYGCTELSPAAAANIPDWEESGFRQIGNRPGTIGRPIPGVAARIVHPDTMEPLPPGQEGMLLIYGANVMKGYLNRPEATRAVIRDGWYVTGDLARYDEDGFLTITDRLARFSKIGGEMVPHQKIEDELHTILGTTERVCVVTGVPDEKRGERLVVLHTPVNGINLHHLWQQLNSRGLPNLWVPAERDFVLIPEVPVLGSGKVDLKRVKQIAQEKLQTNSS